MKQRRDPKISNFCSQTELELFLNPDGEKIIQHILWKVTKTGAVFDCDDAYQEGLIATSIALANHDENKKTRKTTYVYLCVYNAIMQLLRVNSSNKRKFERNMESIDSVIDAADPDSIEDSVIQKERCLALRAAIAKLPPLEKKVMELELKGWTQKLIGSELKASQAKVSGLRTSAIKKLKELLAEYKDDNDTLSQFETEDGEITALNLPTAACTKDEEPSIEVISSTGADTEDLDALWTFCTETVQTPWGRNSPDQIFFVI